MSSSLSSPRCVLDQFMRLHGNGAAFAAEVGIQRRIVLIARVQVTAGGIGCQISISASGAGRPFPSSTRPDTAVSRNTVAAPEWIAAPALLRELQARGYRGQLRSLQT